MKKETAAEKLMALLANANPDVAEKLEDTKKQVNARRGRIHEISEDEIQTFREAQGIIYFLRAPALFQHKVCKHCGEEFLVSRLYVAYCSYTCIRKELNKDGLDWRKGNDIEALVADVYEGNEPIWVRNLDNLKRCLQTLLNESSPQSETRVETSPLLAAPMLQSEPGGTPTLMKL